jgi:hypothetical protein
MVDVRPWLAAVGTYIPKDADSLLKLAPSEAVHANGTQSRSTAPYMLCVALRILLTMGATSLSRLEK